MVETLETEILRNYPECAIAAIDSPLMGSVTSWKRPTWGIARSSCTCRAFPGRHARRSGRYGLMMQELLQTLGILSPSSKGRSSDWPKSPRLLSVKLRQLAPQLRSLGIDVEFVRDGHLRIVTVAMFERRDECTSDYHSVIVDERFRAYIEEQNRSVPPSNRSRKPA